MLRSVLILVAVLLPPLLLVGCDTNVGQMDEDAERQSPFDSCPSDPDKDSPGQCGCGVREDDSDGDGTPDCVDICPSDPNKIRAGQCGCGEPEADSDGDLRADCVDLCPFDPRKLSPGDCGCGELEADSDGDLRADCVDLCPFDPRKFSPGECGCGELETCNALALLVRPVDEIVVLSDLSVWDVGRFTGVTTAIRWLAGDPIEEYTLPADSDADFGLRNLQTNEAVGVDFIGVGSRVTIVGFQEQEFGHRLITLDDGSTWGIFFADENASRTWRVGDDVVIYDARFFDEAINLRTGRVIALDSDSAPPEPEPPPTFVSGDVFSFLTPGETAFFLSRVATLNGAITEAIADELAAAIRRLSASGIQGGAITASILCQSKEDEIRAKREGTWVVLQDVAEFFGISFNLTPSEVQEIEDFNCRE
ncbi:MAG: hypothetical protein IH991_14790 [Planctomycetes bacterium]|nr:hypothetical protein [Planctomycetota bacterium]